MNTSRTKPSDLPAILGGEPIRPAGPPGWPADDPAVTAALQRSISERTWGKYHGPNVEELSRRLADYHAGSEVMLCASGTVGVELALRGLNVGAGDEVLVAAYDFKGNFHNVLAVGAKPVLVDVAASNWNLDPSRLEEAVGPATRAVVVSHLHGGVVPMPTVVELAERHGLAVVEDACQMPGATIYGKVAGTWGDVGVLSFGGSKLLSAGRGGAVVTNRPEIIQRARLYSHRGNEAYPLSELQATVLLPQLDQLDERNRRRAAGAARLRELLGSSGLLQLFENPPSDSEPGYYKLGCQYDPASCGDLSRDLFAAAMRAEGFALDAGFRALHLTHSRRRFRVSGELANASEADSRVLTLHHPILLEGPAALSQLVAAVDRITRHAKMVRESGSSGFAKK